MKIYVERKHFEKLSKFIEKRKLSEEGVKALREIVRYLKNDEDLMIKISRNERKRGYRVIEIDEKSIGEILFYAQRISVKADDLVKTLLVMLAANEEREEKREKEIVKIQLRIAHDVVQQLFAYNWREEFKELVELSDEETWKRIMLVKCPKKDNHIFYWGVEKQLLEKIKKRSKNKKVEEVLCRILTYMVK